MTCIPKSYPKTFQRHLWRQRVCVTEWGRVPCRCVWWKRLLYLVACR